MMLFLALQSQTMAAPQHASLKNDAEMELFNLVKIVTMTFLYQRLIQMEMTDVAALVLRNPAGFAHLLLDKPQIVTEDL